MLLGLIKWWEVMQLSCNGVLLVIPVCHWCKSVGIFPWDKHGLITDRRCWKCFLYGKGEQWRLNSINMWNRNSLRCVYCDFIHTCVRSVTSCSLCVRRDCKRRSSPSISVCFFFISWYFSNATCSECSRSRISASYFSLTRFTLNTCTQAAHRMQMSCKHKGIFQRLMYSILHYCIRG